MSTQTRKRIRTLGQGQLKGSLLAHVAVIVLMVGVLLLAGCSNGSFEGVDVPELENRTFDFVDARAFGLTNLPATLVIGMFGESDLSNDEAPFTLTSNGTVATGILDLDEGDNPFGQDFSRCKFEIQVSAFTVAGLLVGDEVETDCEVTEDNLELKLENRDTGAVSTGTLQP
jgi:hypothetical protein